MNTTEKRAALKVIQNRVRRVQTVLVRDLRTSIRTGTPAPPEVQALSKPIKAAQKKIDALSEKLEAARVVVRKLEREQLDAVGVTFDNSRYGNKGGTDASVTDGVVTVYVKSADKILWDSEMGSRHSGRTFSNVADNLMAYDASREVAEQLTALQDFVDVEAPSDLWLDDTDSADFLAKLTARIEEITS